MELYKVLAGSRLYGTNRLDSDYDWRSVIPEPVESLIGLRKPYEVEQTIKNGQDVSAYGLRKFCALALGANPNILELLYAPKANVYCVSSGFDKILENRASFLSTKVRKTFGGYITSQIKQIEQKDYKPEGAKAGLIEKFGWDTKAGMHLFRLCYQGCVLLKEPDSYSPVLSGFALKECLTILEGKREKERVLADCKVFLRQIDSVETILPEEPDIDKVEELVMNILRGHIESYYYDVY